MIELSDEQKLDIAVTMLSDQETEMYSTVCRYVEQGMLIDDAIDAVLDEFYGS